MNTSIAELIRVVKVKYFIKNEYHVILTP